MSTDGPPRPSLRRGSPGSWATSSGSGPEGRRWCESSGTRSHGSRSRRRSSRCTAMRRSRAARSVSIRGPGRPRDPGPAWHGLRQRGHFGPAAFVDAQANGAQRHAGAASVLELDQPGPREHDERPLRREHPSTAHERAAPWARRSASAAKSDQELASHGGRRRDLGVRSAGSRSCSWGRRHPRPRRACCRRSSGGSRAARGTTSALECDSGGRRAPIRARPRAPPPSRPTRAPASRSRGSGCLRSPPRAHRRSRAR